MFHRVRHPLLRILRVPHDPDPPAGAPGSLRVFRAGRNYYKLRLARWGIGQIGAAIGIVISLTILARIESAVRDVGGEVRKAIIAESAAPAAPEGEPQRRRAQAQARRNRAETIQRLAEKSPGWIFPLLQLLEVGGIFLYLVQIPITYALARLDYELRWYMVTDRSLRIRAGLTTVLESTMSFANIQQVVVSQGPLQRVFGIADLNVQSAGGGGDEGKHGHSESLHKGVLHGVDNAEEIRDLILARLREFREAGLGDPDDTPVAASPRAQHPSVSPVARNSEALDAAQELLAETRALRHALSS